MLDTRKWIEINHVNKISLNRFVQEIIPSRSNVKAQKLEFECTLYYSHKRKITNIFIDLNANTISKPEVPLL